MKRIMLLMMVAMFVLGCTKPASQTTPSEAKDGERSVESAPADSENEPDRLRSDEVNEPKISGYGSDPGEESQE